MKIKISDEILDLNKNVIKEGYTTKTAIIECLITPLIGDEKSDGEMKYKIFSIASKVNSDSEYSDLSLEELSIIKLRSGLLFTPLIIGHLWPILEGDSNGS